MLNYRIAYMSHVELYCKLADRTYENLQYECFRKAITRLYRDLRERRSSNSASRATHYKAYKLQVDVTGKNLSVSSHMNSMTDSDTDMPCHSKNWKR